MNENVKKIYDKTKDVWGEPQVYRGIKFYPLKIRDIEYQKWFNFFFTYPKDSVPDRDIIRMSYLKFATFILQGTLVSQTDENYYLLFDFLNHITHSDIVVEGIILPLQKLGYMPFKKILNLVLYHGIELKDISLKININGIEFYEDGFDDIREIILEQNGLSIEYVNEYNSDLEKKMSFFSNNSNSITVEDELFSFCSLLGITIQEAGEYTIFQYKKHMKRMVVLMDYKLYKPLEVVGQIKVKGGGIKHYLSHFGKEGRYDAIFMKKDEFLNSEEISETAKIAQ